MAGARAADRVSGGRDSTSSSSPIAPHSNSVCRRSRRAGGRSSTRSTRATVAGDLNYRNLQNTPYTLPFASLVLHVFNHATHHRGQASIALVQLGRAAPVMDLPYFLLELPADKLHAA